MSFLRSIENLLGRAGKQVNPFDNGATFKNPNPPPRPRFTSLEQLTGGERYQDKSPISRGLHNINKYRNRAIEALNPWDAQSRAADHLNRTQKNFNLRGDLLGTIQASNPTFTDDLNSGGLRNSTAAATYEQEKYYDPLHRIKINQKYAGGGDMLVHEGLHSLWDKKPSVRGDFVNAYSSGLDKPLKKYLTGRISNYRENRGQDFGNFNTLPRSIQTELHSYIPEYLAHQPGGNDALRQYYGQYMDLDRKRQRDGLRSAIIRLLHPQPPEGY